MHQKFSAFWLGFFAIAMSLSWLLPNHSMPWMGFHADSWAAVVLLTIAFFVLLLTRFNADWHSFTRLTSIAVAIPLLQYAFGLTPQFGVAWVNSAYILGFLLALLVGSVWEKNHSNQCGDFLFLALAIASTVSVALQLHQFFNLEGIGPWILNSSGTRHYANMAQPNQLASLLLLGFLGCGWGYWRRLIGPVTAICGAALFLLGVTLTESRTAWINVLFFLCAALFWRKSLPSKGYLWSVMGLALFFAIFVLNLPAINIYFGGAVPVEYRSTTGDPRWIAWVMFFKAISFQPWFGFGWGQLGHAQFLMMNEHIALGGSFLQAHNLFIDLMLWNGVPIGLGIGAAIVWWFWTVLKSIHNFQQLVLTCFVLVLGTHAMLEYPLQYAYFLLPTGLVMGCLNTSLELKSFKVKSKWPAATVLALSTVTLAITIRDYFRVEDSFYGLRFEQKNIESSYPRTPPNVIALSQWRDYIVFARMEPGAGMTGEELSWARNLVSTTPSAFVMYRLATMLALNEHPDEAGKWLRRLCLTSPKEHCDVIKLEWEKQAKQQAKIQAIPWPN
jgi:hypothetical protein